MHSPNGLPSVQDIQLDLLRRTHRNNLNGELIVRDLLDHRDLWQACLLDSNKSMGLIKLRDLPENIWNADTLYVLVPDEASGHRLLEFAEGWLADTAHMFSADESQDELGDSGINSRVVEFWWD